MVMGYGDMESPSSVALVAANEQMHEAMLVSISCDHTVDFVRQMVPHHKAAIEMCSILLSEASTADVYLDELCANITRVQRAEVAWMELWLHERGHPVHTCRAAL